MKRLILSVVITLGIFGCASNRPAYNQAQFATENYQQNISNAIEYADNFVDFDKESNTEAYLDTADFSILLTADIAYNQGKYQEVAASYYYLGKKYLDPKLIYKGIVSYEHISDTKDENDRLSELIDKLIQVAPDSNISKLFGIRVALEKNNLSVAKRNLNYVIKSNPERTRAVLLLLSTIFSNDLQYKVTNSLNEFGKYVLKKYNYYPEAHLLAIVSYSIYNNKNDLLLSFKEINQTYPNWEIPAYWSAGVLIKTGNLSLILDMLSYELKEFNNPSIALKNLYIGALIKSKNLTEAADFIAKEQAKTPKEPALMVGNAIVNYKMGNTYKTVQSLEEAKSQGFELYGITDLALASLYDFKSNTESAIAYYEAAIKTNALTRPLANVGLLNAYLQTKQNKKANKYLDDTIAVMNLSKNASAILKISIFFELKKYDLAYSLAEKQIHLHHNDKAFVYLYASLSELTGRTDQAIKLYKQYIKMNPKDSSGYNDLGFLLADKTSRKKEAYQYALKAYEIEPKNPNVLDTIGWANYQLGNYSDAESYIKIAYDKTQDPETAQHLKKVYLKEGKNDLGNAVVILENSSQQLQIKQSILNQTMDLLVYLMFGLDSSQ